MQCSFILTVSGASPDQKDCVGLRQKPQVMIQRIQTLYFLFALVLYVLMFFMPYALMPEVSSELYVYGVVQTVNGISATELSFWPLAVLCGLVILVTGITIFLFRNRTVQMRVSINLMIVMAVSSVFMWFNAYQLGPEHIVYRLPSLFPALAIILTFMAWHGIRRDDRLVRSSDRLR
jgi:hypothetical protein